MPKISKYNGGYVIISLNDEDIYEKIERNLYKPVLLTDIVINGIEKNDVFTTAYVEGTNIVFKDIYDKDITISDDNSVSIDDNGEHLYRHQLSMNVNIDSTYNTYLAITIYTNNGQPITEGTLKNYISRETNHDGINCNGSLNNGELVLSIRYATNGNYNIWTNGDHNLDIYEFYWFEDSITQIF